MLQEQGWPYGATTSFCIVYSEHSQTSKMKVFAKIIINGYFHENFIIDVLQGFEYASTLEFYYLYY